MTDTPDTEALLAQYERLLDRVESNEREFRRLARAVARVEEDERRRLARELHDGLGQTLTALKHRLAQLGGDVAPEARDRLDAAIALCGDALEDTRALSRLLRPPILDDLGLEAALRALARTLGESSGLSIDVAVEPLPDLDGDLQTLVFRVAQDHFLRLRMLGRVVQRFLRDAEDERLQVAVQVGQRFHGDDDRQAARFAERAGEGAQCGFEAEDVEERRTQQARQRARVFQSIATQLDRGIQAYARLRRDPVAE